ncbi:MAG: hypothetical protein M5U12_24560 [Verrucomicrobia bacterium]|nr:hypothetical protein [Verrucomicrobiota bacterium]
MELDGIELPSPMPDEELLALDEALTRLAANHPQAGTTGSALRFSRA